MGVSFANLIIILLIVLVIFGAGKLPDIMADLGKGIRNFKKNLKDDSDDNDSQGKIENKNLSEK